MIYRWPTKRERALRNSEISALKKLEGLKAMNELIISSRGQASKLQNSREKQRICMNPTGI